VVRIVENKNPKKHMVSVFFLFKNMQKANLMSHTVFFQLWTNGLLSTTVFYRKIKNLNSFAGQLG
jgi:hypothetical protein